MILTWGKDGKLKRTPRSMTAMIRVIESNQPYDMEGRASAVDFIIAGPCPALGWMRGAL